MALPAQTFTTLHNFDGTDGATPAAGLVQGTNGDGYGTTEYGGANCAPAGCGTVFKITASGALTTLYSFCAQSGCVDGSYPEAGLVQATNGDFYGTTVDGGTNGGGTIFKVTPSGTLTTLYSFCAQSRCTDGSFPLAGLIQATNGDLYGTTVNGGTTSDGEHDAGAGTVFRITLGGTLTTLYSFGRAETDGKFPDGGIVQAADGDFYGTTYSGGTRRLYGTVFKITPSGTLTMLYSFCSQTNCADGANPLAGFVQATNGDLYGTAGYGGIAGDGEPYVGDGTVFKITTGGALTTLYSFCALSGCTDGKFPGTGVVQATNGDLYGTTLYGGGNGQGTVFNLTPGGALTTLYSFCAQSGCTDGAGPIAGLVQATNGEFYGTTSGLTSSPVNHGTVFSLSVGLGPFVKTLPTSGTVGAAVKILGSDLTAATSVTFNGTTATFSVASPSLITTTVPTGATTGTVAVVTSRGTLSSNVPFRVLP
jgi:uncharacterized repeat protein (TIGR03803 family)